MDKHQKGFTTVELVIVIAVIAILATVLIPTFSNLIDKANKSATLSDAYALYKSWLVENAANVKDDTVLAIVVGETGSEVVYLFENNQLNKEPATARRLPCNTIVICKNDAISLPTGFTLDPHTNAANADALCAVCGTSHIHNFDNADGSTSRYCACGTEHEHKFDGPESPFCACGIGHEHKYIIVDYTKVCELCGLYKPKYIKDRQLPVFLFLPANRHSPPVLRVVLLR